MTGRPGARFGPSGIRLGSRRLGGWSVYTGLNAFEDWAKVVDCGDAPLTWLDNTFALKQLDLAHKVQSYTLIESAIVNPDVHCVDCLVSFNQCD